ncbi:MAG: CNNM domain-containing protein, partial [Kiloniellales bacterium]|nr:CNNM domain-containing protein [Kiloniellales bacterium]
MEWTLQTLAQYAEAAEAFFAFDTARLLEPHIVLALCLQVILFCCSAFFSGSETALFSLSRLDLQKLRRQRHPRSDALHALLDQPRSLIISILCGNELVNIAATANLAGILVHLYGESRAGWINVLVMFPLLLLLGELTPKTIAVGNPVRVSTNLVAVPLSLWVKLIAPLRRIVRVVADTVTTWIVGKERGLENLLQKDELRSLLAEVADEGILDATERVLIDNLLEAGETEIVEIMTPRTRINFLKDSMTVAEAVEAFRKYRHPRVPVCHEHHDSLVGFVHAEDILRLTLDGANLADYSLADIMHPPVVVPPTKYVDEMFDFFEAHNVRAAVVLNEFGGVDGFITMRDIIKFIFGEISGAVPGQEAYREKDGNVF